MAKQVNRQGWTGAGQAGGVRHTRRDGAALRGPAQLIAAALALATGQLALAGPEGSQVVRGDATIERRGNETIIRAGDRAILQHRSFDIARDESVRFIQPGADARVLNRITGAAPTRIDGSLSANGRVYIVNPAGVIFGQSAVVDVGGLFAAAGNLSNADFVAGVDRVTGMTGQVRNEGSLRGQAITLAGARVANVGSIVAPSGSVALAAGENVIVQDRGSGMFVRVDGAALGDGATAAVTNTGTIDTSGPLGGGKVVMAAGDVYGLAIRNSGVVRGASVTIEGQGRGRVVDEGGTISARDQRLVGRPRAQSDWQSPAPTAPRRPWSASGGVMGLARAGGGGSGGSGGVAIVGGGGAVRGGSVTITGEQVGLFATTLDVSGRDGGGSVRIGGDVRGRGELRNATMLAVNEATNIQADALERGNGGSVVLFSSDTTRAFAQISARGGAQGGNGGFIETSGLEHISVRGDRIDASARTADGKSGQWLIDPRNVLINSTGPTTGGAFDAGTPDIFTPTSDDSIVRVSDIESRLNAGTSVTITTGSTGTQTGVVSINDSITLSASAPNDVTFRVEAADNITLASGIGITSDGPRFNIELVADSSDANDPNPGSGSVLFNGPVSLNSRGGSILLRGASFVAPLAGVVISDGLVANSAGLINVQVDALTLNPSVPNFVGVNRLVIQPRSASTEIGLGTGAAGQLIVNDALLADLRTTGFSQITFGSADAARLHTTATAELTSSTVGRWRLVADRASLGGLVSTGTAPVVFAFDTGTVTQTDAIDIGSLALTGDARYVLTNESNRIVQFASNAPGGFEVRTSNAQGLNITEVANVNGLTVLADSSIRAPLSISVSRPVSITGVGLSLQTETIDITAGITGTGSSRLSLRPEDPTRSVALNGIVGSGGFSIEQAELDFITGVRRLDIGREDGTSVVFASNELTFTVPTRILMGGTGGQIDWNAQTLATDGLTLRSDAGTTLRQNILTSGDPVEVTGGLIIDGDRRIDTTDVGTRADGASVVLSGGINALTGVGDVLTIRAGSTGDVTLSATGQTTRLASVDVLARTVLLQDGVLTTGAQTFAATGASGVTARGTLNSNGAGAITIAGPLTLGAQALTIQTAGASGDDIVLGGVVSGTQDGGSLGLNAGAARVVLPAGGIALVDAFNVQGGSIELGGDVSGTTVRFQGPVVLTGNATVVGSASVRFDSTIDSQVLQAHTLAINSPITTLQGAIGQGSGSQLGSLSSDGAGTLTLSAGSVRANSVSLEDEFIELTGDTTITSTGDVVLGAVDSDSTTARSLTINAVGNVDLNSAVGGQRQLALLDVTGASIDLRGNVRTAGIQRYAGPTSVRTVTLTGSGVTFTSTVDALLELPRTLTINAGSGDVSFGGAVGAGVALAALDVTAGNIALRGVNTTGSQRYDGRASVQGSFASTTSGPIDFVRDVELVGDTTIASSGATNADGVFFRGRVNSRATPFALTVGGGANGAVRFELGVGDGQGGTGLVSLASLTASGNSIDVLGGVTTTGGQLYTGRLALGSDLRSTQTGSIGVAGATFLLSDATVATTAGDVTFNGTIDSQGSTARSLSVNTGGNGTTRFGGVVGGTARLQQLSTNADGTTILAATQVRTVGDQVYNDAVRLGTNMVVEGNDITFGQTLDSDSTSTPRTLTVNTVGQGADEGDTLFGGRVGSLARLQSITTNADGTTRIAADISAARGISFNDAVRISANAVSINAGSGTLSFRGLIDADTTVTDPTVRLFSTAAGDTNSTAFRFGAGIGTQRRLGGLFIGTDRAVPTLGAGVVFADSFDNNGRIEAAGVAPGDTFSIITGTGGLTIAQGLRTTAFGSFNATSAGRITLNDVSALGAIVVNADQITIRRRPGAELRTREGAIVRDTGVDFLAGGALNFQRTPQLVGSGANPTFSFGSGQADPELSGFIFRELTAPISVATFRDPASASFLLPIDLRATGSTRTVITSAVIQPTPPLGAPLGAGRVELNADLASGLAELGIPVGDPGVVARADALRGRTFDDRLPLADGMLPPAVSSQRLSPAAVRRAVEAYRSIAWTRDEAGQQVSALEGVRSVLGESWTRYAATTARPTGAGWRAALQSAGSLRTPEDARALALLDQISGALRALRDLGLADAQTNQAIEKLLGETQPPEVPSRDEFLAAVEGRVVASATR